MRKRRAAYYNTRCVDGRTMRHDPQPDDPYLQTDIGECEECGGEGCEIIDGADDMATIALMSWNEAIEAAAAVAEEHVHSSHRLVVSASIRALRRSLSSEPSTREKT